MSADIPGRSFFSRSHLIVYWAGLVLVVFATFWPGGDAKWRVDAFIVFAAALMLNAAIFGGLSAPVERYTERIAFIPALLALIMTTRLKRP